MFPFVDGMNNSEVDETLLALMIHFEVSHPKQRVLGFPLEERRKHLAFYIGLYLQFGYKRS